MAAGLAFPFSQATRRGPGDPTNSAQACEAGEERRGEAGWEPGGRFPALHPETTDTALCCPRRRLSCRRSTAGAHTVSPSPSSTHSPPHTKAPGVPGGLKGRAGNLGQEPLMSPAWTSQSSTSPRAFTQKNPTGGKFRRCSLPPVPCHLSRGSRRPRMAQLPRNQLWTWPVPRLTSKRGS